MKAWVVREFGGPEQMHWEEWPDPVAAAGQVVIRVQASGINFAETRMRMGSYGGITRPLVLGMESAGFVEQVGCGVTQLKVGDRVMARARGSHAEKVLADARKVMPLPSALDFVQGAAVPVGWHTAWHALVTVARLRAGQRVLIEAIASSVGSAALQIARRHGCWVAGSASRDDKLATAREWGADAVYNYKTEDFVSRAIADTDGQGIDIACATIGAETLERVLACMANEGQVLMYGSTGGRVVTFDLRCGERNVALRTLSIDTSSRYYSESVPSFNLFALPAFADGRYKPVVSTVLPMSELARAHEMLGDRRHFGKLIMVNE